MVCSRIYVDTGDGESPSFFALANGEGKHFLQATSVKMGRGVAMEMVDGNLCFIPIDGAKRLEYAFGTIRGIYD